MGTDKHTCTGPSHRYDGRYECSTCSSILGTARPFRRVASSRCRIRFTSPSIATTCPHWNYMNPLRGEFGALQVAYGNTTLRVLLSHDYPNAYHDACQGISIPFHISGRILTCESLYPPSISFRFTFSMSTTLCIPQKVKSTLSRARK